MQRAAAGETFHVTRRGKPFVVLSPAETAKPAEEVGRELPFPDLKEATNPHSSGEPPPEILRDLVEDHLTDDPPTSPGESRLH